MPGKWAKTECPECGYRDITIVPSRDDWCPRCFEEKVPDMTVIEEGVEAGLGEYPPPEWHEWKDEGTEWEC